MRDIDLEALKDRVVQLYRRNRVATGGRPYHAPSLGPWAQLQQSGWPRSWLWKVAWHLFAPMTVRYPHQWFWDSCAHAIVLSYLEPELAWRELRSLLALQSPEGAIPHMAWSPSWKHWRDIPMSYLYANPTGSPYIQPPNLARSLELVFEKTGREDELMEVLPGVAHFYVYLEAARDIDGDGLLVIIHPYESGRDRSPEFDVALGASTARTAWPLLRLIFRHHKARWRWEEIVSRGDFLVKEVLFNCVYARNLASLARLEERVGDAPAARSFKERAARTEASILAKMLDPQTGLAYCLDRRQRAESLIKVPTIASLMPLLLETIPEAAVLRLVQDHLTNPNEFWLPYPVPATLGSSSSIRGHVIWRGAQTWIYTNWLIVEGLYLQAHRFPGMRDSLLKVAHEIALKSYALVCQEGFREYYDSRSGRGGGARDMGWSALALDMLSRSPGGA
ncbi:MAG: hypothetical protein HY676_03775 [Chloroflexi bacterium]|nr:hypothetical protein [Chloroflexota bacterium]